MADITNNLSTPPENLNEKFTLKEGTPATFIFEMRKKVAQKIFQIIGAM